jgi:hypothetical protein
VAQLLICSEVGLRFSFSGGRRLAAPSGNHANGRARLSRLQGMQYETLSIRFWKIEARLQRSEIEEKLFSPFCSFFIPEPLPKQDFRLLSFRESTKDCLTSVNCGRYSALARRNCLRPLIVALKTTTAAEQRGFSGKMESHPRAAACLSHGVNE